MTKLDNLLLCPGAQKAGTTWLYNILSNECSDIEFSNFKELHYFDYKAGLNEQLSNLIIRRLAKAALTEKEVILSTLLQRDARRRLNHILDDKWYIDQFPSVKKYSADFTPEYALLDAVEMKRIYDVARHPKIIYIMRDPVERAISALKYFHKNRGRTLKQVSDNLLSKQCESDLTLRQSQYHKTIDAITQTFAESDVLYLYFEDIMADKEKAIYEVEQFLGVNILSETTTIDLSSKINSSSKERAPDFVCQKLQNKLGHIKYEVNERLGYYPTAWS